VQAGGDVQIRSGGFEEPTRMIVEQHFAALRDAGQRQHRVDRPSRDDARIRERAVGIRADDEGHLAPVGRGDLLLQQRARVAERRSTLTSSARASSLRERGRY